MVISDTCSAGTLFTTTSSESVKALLLGSSEWNDYALSMGYDDYIGQPLKDKFSYQLIKFLKNLVKRKKKIFFDDFLKNFSKNKIDSSIFFLNYMK